MWKNGFEVPRRPLVLLVIFLSLPVNATQSAYPIRVHAATSPADQTDISWVFSPLQEISGLIAHTRWTTPISESAAITVQPSSSSSTALSTFVQSEVRATQGPSHRRPRTDEEVFDGQRNLDSNLSQEGALINLQGEDTDNHTGLRSPHDHPSEKDEHRAGLPKEMLPDEERISFVTSLITEVLKDSCHHQMFEPQSHRLGGFSVGPVNRYSVDLALTRLDSEWKPETVLPFVKTITDIAVALTSRLEENNQLNDELKAREAKVRGDETKLHLGQAQLRADEAKLKDDRQTHHANVELFNKEQADLDDDRQKHHDDVELFHKKRQDLNDDLQKYGADVELFDKEREDFGKDAAQLGLDQDALAKREEAVEEREKAQEIREQTQKEDLCHIMLDIVATYSDSTTWTRILISYQMERDRRETILVLFGIFVFVFGFLMYRAVIRYKRRHSGTYPGTGSPRRDDLPRSGDKSLSSRTAPNLSYKEKRRLAEEARRRARAPLALEYSARMKKQSAATPGKYGVLARLPILALVNRFKQMAARVILACLFALDVFNRVKRAVVTYFPAGIIFNRLKRTVLACLSPLAILNRFKRTVSVSESEGETENSSVVCVPVDIATSKSSLAAPTSSIRLRTRKSSASELVKDKTWTLEVQEGLPWYTYQALASSQSRPEAGVEGPTPASIATTTMPAPNVTKPPKLSSPVAELSATLFKATKLKGQGSAGARGVVKENATVTSVVDLDNVVRAHATSLERDLALAEAQTSSPATVAICAPRVAIDSVKVSAPPVTNVAKAADTGSLTEASLPSKVSSPVTDVHVRTTSSKETNEVTGAGEMVESFDWSEDFDTPATYAPLTEPFRLPAKPTLDTKAEADIEWQFHALRTYRVEQPIQMRPPVLDNADMSSQALRQQTVDSPLIRPVTSTVLREPTVQVPYPLDSASVNRGRLLAGDRPPRVNGSLDKAALDSGITSSKSVLGFGSGSTLESNGASGQPQLPTSASVDVFQSAAAVMLRAAPLKTPIHPPVAQSRTNDVGSHVFSIPGPTLKGEEVVKDARPNAPKAGGSKVVSPDTANPTTPPPVRASANPVGSETNGSLINANKFPQANSASSFAGVASASLSTAQKHGPVPASRQTRQRGSKLPRRVDAAKQPSVDTNAPIKEYNLEYCSEDGSETLCRGGQSSGIEEDKAGESARLLLQAEQGENDNVALEKGGDDKVESQVAGDGEGELQGTEAGFVELGGE